MMKSDTEFQKEAAKLREMTERKPEVQMWLAQNGFTILAQVPASRIGEIIEAVKQYHRRVN